MLGLGQLPNTFSRRLGTILLVLVGVLLTGCFVKELPDLSTAGEVPDDYRPWSPESGSERSFDLTDESRIQVLVYRSGRLARMGHNHVIAGIPMGFVALDQGRLRADIFLSLADLRVDDPALRQAAGTDFDSTPSDKDIAGTRANMLSEKLLNAGNFPFIRAQFSAQRVAVAANAGWSVELQMAGASHQLRVRPREIEMVDCELKAAGSFEFSHADFGLTPYSVLGGALSVADPVVVQFEIVAVDRQCQGADGSRDESQPSPRSSRP